MEHGTRSKFAVLFEDNEEFADQRMIHMAEHLSFLERNSDQIEAAGPLFDSSDDSGAGGLWVVDAESPEAVLALVHEDPFWPTGLRKVVRILNWKQVFSNDQRFFHQ